MARGDFASRPELAAAAVRFAATMPAAYRDAFEDDDVEVHAAIVARRGARSCWVEAWREMPGRTLALCVVADDQPGLVSRISAALAGASLDVVDAHAYCRTLEDGRVEAVDFFWVRRVDDRGEPVPLRAPEIDQLDTAIVALVTGRLSIDEAARPRTLPPPPAEAASVRVRFDRDPREGAVLLTVHAPDRPGLLLALTQVLFRADVQIVGLRATSDRGAARDFFQLTELDGSSLSEARMRELQPLVFEAIASTLAG